MTCAHCQGLESFFNRREADRALRRYRKRGPEKTTRALIDALGAEGISGVSALDIGGGVGAIPNALIDAGAARATDVDVSSAYLAAARGEAARRGHADRIEFRHGDFVAMASSLPSVDVVTLDRVVCCYPDVAALVRSSAGRARRFYGLVLPRDAWWTRAAIVVMNLALRLFRNPMRTFVHPDAVVDGLLNDAGFAATFRRKMGFWQVVVWARRSGSPEG